MEDEFERGFTPDGHLVGSLGEVIVAYAFGLNLATASTPCYDALDRDGKRVQIKMTGGSRGVALRACPDYLIVIRLDRSGDTELVYNGLGRLVWSNCGTRQSNGQHPISLAELRKLNADAGNDRIKQVREFPDLRAD